MPVGAAFTYSAAVYFVDFGPPLPAPFTVVFFGTKNGVNDIGPAGERYPLNIAGNRVVVLPGYGNPGGVSGTYTRYAKIYEGNWLVCTTNSVTLTLQ